MFTVYFSPKNNIVCILALMQMACMKHGSWPNRKVGFYFRTNRDEI